MWVGYCHPPSVGGSELEISGLVGGVDFSVRPTFCRVRLPLIDVFPSSVRFDHRITDRGQRLGD